MVGWKFLEHETVEKCLINNVLKFFEYNDGVNRTWEHNKPMSSAVGEDHTLEEIIIMNQMLKCIRSSRVYTIQLIH